MSTRAEGTVRRTQAERSTATTDRLCRSARRLFADKGFTATSLDEIVRDAGLTKGAVYHHFAGKREVFREIYEREQRGLVRVAAQAASRESDPWDGLKAGWLAFLDASQEPSVQRITMQEAPVALGWETARRINSDQSIALLVTGLERAIKAGRVADQPVRPLARLLLAAMCEASMAIASSDDPEMQDQVLAAVDALLTGLEIRRSPVSRR